eukprot:2794413-Heterocapsa_arctica.AAC.1
MNKLKGYVTPDKLIRPALSTPEGTKKEREAEAAYSYELGLYSRVTAALQDAYATLDTYLNLMGAALRPANETELRIFSPSIIPEAADMLQKEAMDDAQRLAVTLPPP